MYIPPPVLLVIAIGTTFFVSALFPGWQFNSPAFPFLGVIFIIAGVGLVAWAARTLSSYKTTLNPRGKPTKLVTKGPYAVSRNPIYLGFLLIAVGTALFFANVLAFAGPLLFFGFARMFVIPFEEQTLRRIFGTVYNTYSKHTRRWV